MTLKEYLQSINACLPAIEWALAQDTLQLRELFARASVDYQRWFIRNSSLFSVETLQWFTLHCARNVQHITKDARSITAINTTEAYLCGLVSHECLAIARMNAAYAAAAAHAAAAAYAAYAAYAAAYAATWKQNIQFLLNDPKVEWPTFTARE